MKKINSTVSIAATLFAVTLSFHFATAQQTSIVNKFPAAATNVQTLPAGKLWANPQNVVSLNNGAATVSLAKNGICTATKCYRSAYLQADHFGFNLTNNDSVLGIEIKVRLKASVANSVKTLSVRPVSPSSIMCCDEEGDQGFWPTAYTIRTYGGPNETWGIIDYCCWDQNPITNAPDFGLRISVQNLKATAGAKATIDYVRMTVYYTSNGPRIESQTREAGEIDSWQFYPNPVTDNLQLVSFNDASNAIVKIFNTQGQLVIEKNIGELKENETMEIETASLSKGIYLMQINSEGESVTKRFVKE